MMLTAMCWSSLLTVAFTPTITMLGETTKHIDPDLDPNQSQTTFLTLPGPDQESIFAGTPTPAAGAGAPTW